MLELEEQTAVCAPGIKRPPKEKGIQEEFNITQTAVKRVPPMIQMVVTQLHKMKNFFFISLIPSPNDICTSNIISITVIRSVASVQAGWTEAS